MGLAPAAVVVRPDEDHRDVELALLDIRDLEVRRRPASRCRRIGRAAAAPRRRSASRRAAARAEQQSGRDHDDSHLGRLASMRPPPHHRRRRSRRPRWRPPRSRLGLRPPRRPSRSRVRRSAKHSRPRTASSGSSGTVSRVDRSCTIRAMFERTALASGPRVISARVPGARSVSIAAYVLAGSRLETPGQAGVAHFMEHITFKGTSAYPTTRAISEAIEGVGGSFNAATDRESTVYWVRVPRREARRAVDVLGELIVRPTARRRRDRQRARGHRRGDPLLPGRSVRVRPDPLPAGDVRRRRRSAARSAATRRASGPCPRRRSASSGGDLSAGEHGRGGRRRPRPRGGGRPASRPRSAPATGSPGLRRRTRPARRAAVPARQARHVAGPALPRRSRRSSATTRTLGRWPSSTPCWGTG